MKVIGKKNTNFEKEYIVMGILVSNDSNKVDYLIDNCSFSFWQPCNLFEVTDNELPPNWYFKLNDKKLYSENIICFSGFYELCNIDKYHDLLIGEWDRNALDIYFKRKNEIKEWYWQKELKEIKANPNAKQN